MLPKPFFNRNGAVTLLPNSEANGKLRSEVALEIIRDKIAVDHAVLQFELKVCREAVTHSGVNPPDIRWSGYGLAGWIVSGNEKFLVPAQCAEKLRRDFVLRLHIIGENVSIAEARNFEA